jgi:hypothetical protein
MRAPSGVGPAGGFLDSAGGRGENTPGTHKRIAALLLARTYMIAVIGNVIAALGVISLFTATLRLSKPGKQA